MLLPQAAALFILLVLSPLLLKKTTIFTPIQGNFTIKRRLHSIFKSGGFVLVFTLNMYYFWGCVLFWFIGFPNTQSQLYYFLSLITPTRSTYLLLFPLE